MDFPLRLAPLVWGISRLRHLKPEDNCFSFEANITVASPSKGKRYVYLHEWVTDAF
jgi:hypothetical protein